jgi:hypothetical protein
MMTRALNALVRPTPYARRKFRRLRWGGRHRPATLLALVDILRAASFGKPLFAVAANADAALAGSVYMSTLMTAVYNLARSALSHALPDRRRRRLGLGAAGACLGAAGLLTLGAPMPVAILLTLPATAALFALLRRYYASREAERPTAS